jgi:O-antigen/teichoic acid export membrane protein
MNAATSQTREPESISGSLKSGVLWVAGLNLFRDLLQFGLMLVLVRILEPKAYGQFGLVTSIIGFFTFISYRCVSEHMLQARPHEVIDYQTQFTSAGVIQSTLFVVVNLVALAMRHFTAYAESAPLVHVMSFMFLLDWPNEFRFKMLEKALDWKRLRLLQAAGSILTALAALVLALAGFGVYALLVPSMLVTLPFIYDLFFEAKWKPDWSFKWGYFCEAAKYGLARAGSGAVVFGRQLLESAIFVQFIGYAQYGIYGRAIGLANICCLKMPSFVTPLLYPLLTRLEAGTAAYRRANGLVLRGIAWTVLPVAILLSSIGGPVVKLVYGRRWEAAIPLLPLAMATSALTAVQQTLSVMLLANRQQRRCLISDIVLMCGSVLCLLFLLRRGVAVYLAGIVLTQTISLLLMLFWLVSDRVIDARILWTALICPIGAAVAASLLCRRFAPDASPALLQSAHVAAVILIFSLVYIGLLRIALPQSLSELLTYFPGGPVFRRALLLTA